MTDVRDVTCLPPAKRALWWIVALGAAGTVLAATGTAYRGGLGYLWLGVGLASVLAGTVALHALAARTTADASGLRIRTLRGGRSVAWHEVADLRVHLRHTRNGEFRRVAAVLRDGRRLFLPLPLSGRSDDPEFDATLDALRTLHRRYGTPASSHLPVISSRTAGRGWAGSLTVCVLLLAGAGVAAWTVPQAAAEEAAWNAARPCAAGTPAGERTECLDKLPAVIERTDADRPKQQGRLYFTGGGPLGRLEVTREAAQGFRPGDRVELTVWRGAVREVSGRHYVWHDRVGGAGDLAVGAAVLALAAGYPAAQLVLRLRGRRLPDDEVLPSALPFAGALAGTALWLLPLCHLHPATLFTSPVPIAWGASGTLASLVFLTAAWRATRLRAPRPAAVSDGPAGREGEEVFLPARFLEPTDYNPHGFGTHIALGDGPPAVTPGPGRFAAKPIPMGRLTLKAVRRVRGGDGDTVSRSWHIAELDDAGTPVRLAAAPDDLHRILRELDPAGAGAMAHP
ncbi:PH domain-containing protein [Streptomyces sp. NPDC001544]|uniref:PH domain-containing protein n=1 Tax=Streptomyces sp. NPDC001544 TaxID=3364584 RepID=UPI00367ADBAB